MEIRAGTSPRGAAPHAVRDCILHDWTSASSELTPLPWQQREALRFLLKKENGIFIYISGSYDEYSTRRQLDVSEEEIASIFRLKQKANHEAIVKSCLSPAFILFSFLALTFNHGDGAGMFLRNVGRLSVIFVAV